ncbi:MAG: glutamine synthetase [Gammaproteobacteria bacterium]|nr:glutamine synthetase [Gammaproteobacteria bacterium]
MNIDQIVQQARDTETQLVRFIYCDSSGVIRGKATHIDHLSGRMVYGIGLTVAMQSFTSSETIAPGAGFGPVGEIRLVPDPETFTTLPYSPGNARMIADMFTLDRKPWANCPRFFLKRMIERANDLGLRMKAAFESEFSLIIETDDGYEPFDRSLCFSTVGMDYADEYIGDLVEALGQQGINVEQYYAELGAGQQELSVTYADALRAADNQITLRDTARGVAMKQGLIASFAPKPFANEAGNGCHIHFSAWDKEGETNLFFDAGDRYKLSPIAYQFIAGVLHHLPGLLGLSAPSVNSYRRLQPHFWSSAFVCFGPDNREAPVRIASGFWGDEMKTVNLELKPSDSSHNPYLALGGLIAAGLDGIEKELQPPEPVLMDPGDMQESERKDKGIERLPTSLKEATDALGRDEVLMEAMGEVLSREYLLIKSADWESSRDQEVESELHQYIHRY